MEVVVLGSAAGGGFPQWNCNAPTSKRAREGAACAKWRTQASVAVSADGGSRAGKARPAELTTAVAETMLGA